MNNLKINNVEKKENDKDKCKCNHDLEKYKITLDFLKFEATTLWQIFSAYFIGHAIIIGFISSAFVKNKSDEINFNLLLIAGIIGFLLTLLWFGTFHGNSRWYYFRIREQAKKAEDVFVKSIKDENWYLLNKDAEKFAKNNSFISNKTSGYCIIAIFALIYLFIILWSICKL